MQKENQNTSLVTKEFILKLFEAFSIQRWNDFIRPLPLTEMDRAGEKLFVAFFLGKQEEKKGNPICWNTIIDGSVYEMLRRIQLSDIKSPVQRLIREKFPDEAKRLNEWIFENYKGMISDTAFMNGFYKYLFEHEEKKLLSYTVLRAAHKYATLREFEILRMVNEKDRLGKVDEYLKKDMLEFENLTGLNDFLQKGTSYKLIIEIEKLRFQERWNQSPRVPKTSVLGHSFFVAVVTLLISKGLNFSAQRQCNNFFAALFHDLPEAVTRDIISPVKRATSYLAEALKQIEDTVMEQELFPLIDPFYEPDIRYFLESEFENKALVDGSVKICSFEQLNTCYAQAQYKPTDGKLVRVADHIAAFVEADRSIAYGISSQHLQRGRDTILSIYKNANPINNFDVSQFFNSF